MTKLAQSFINLTPHAVAVIAYNGETVTIAPSGIAARVEMSPGENLEPWDGIPMQQAGQYGKVTFVTPEGTIAQEDLPKPGYGSPRYIVSLMVAEAMRAADAERSLFCRPDTGPDAIREGRQVKAVRRFIKA